jgi:hypothetical protein
MVSLLEGLIKNAKTRGGKILLTVDEAEQLVAELQRAKTSTQPAELRNTNARSDPEPETR